MLTKRAFSRTANLGQLYDAHNDMLLPANILNLNNDDITSKSIKQNKNEYIEHDFLYAYTNDDQFSHLDIDSSLRLNLYAGLVDIGGSGKYLLSSKSTDSSIKGSFYYKLVKEDDELMIENLWADAISNDESEKIFNVPVLFGEMSKNATHIVVKRQFGADLFFTFESKKGDKEMLKKIETRVQVAVTDIVSVELGVSTNRNINTNYEDIHVSFYGDSKPPSKYRGTVDSVLECLQEIGEMTTEPKQMKWILYPIEHLSKLQEILSMKPSNINTEWTKLGYIIKPSNYISNELETDNYKLLFYNWDILLKNKNTLDTLEKQIHNNDISAYRLIIRQIKQKQIEINSRYNNEVIDKVKHIKTKNKKLDVEQLITSINEINDEIEKYLNTSNKINLNSDGKQNILTKKKLNTLMGNNYVYFINRDFINVDEHDRMCKLIKNFQNSYLPNNYYFFCNTHSNIELYKNSIRYINLCQVSNCIDESQRWLHINNIKVYDEFEKEISLFSLYIKIRYSSKSEEWSTGDIISDNNNSFFHSKNGDNEWIEIDLGKNIKLSKIILFNRHDYDNPHDNIVRITGAKLSLWNDFSDFGNRILVSEAIITARALKYEFKINEKGIVDSNDYLKVFNNRKGELYENLYEIIYTTEYEQRLLKSELESELKLKSEPNFRLPACGFKWSKSIVKVAGNNISHKVKFDKDLLYLPYYITDNVNITISSNDVNNIYNLWNHVIVSKYKNQIMWYPDSEAKNINSINGQYLHDLFMPCPHDYRAILNKINYKDWVCYLCNSIAKIRKIKNIWYFNCYECNKVVKLSDCYFICNNSSHGNEPYKFNGSFNCDNSKFNYMMGNYSYKSCFLCFDKINIEKNAITYEENSYFFGTRTSKSEVFCSFSPFTIFDSQDYWHNYTTIDLINHIGYMFLFDDNKYKSHYELKMDNYHGKRLFDTVSINFTNNNDTTNDQMVDNIKWTNTKNNLTVEFIKENKVCKINDQEYFYSNINPHTSIVVYEKNKFFKTSTYKWFFMLNTHLDKIIAILLKNNNFKFHYVLTC